MERPGNVWHWIKNYTQEVILHKCMFLGKMAEEDLLDVNSVKNWENDLGWYIKNNVEPLLVAVRTSRTITHKETVEFKEFRKTKEKGKMNALQNECMDNLLVIWRTRIRTTHGWMRKSDLKGCTEPLICSTQNSLCRLTIPSTLLTKLPSHSFVGCVV